MTPEDIARLSKIFKNSDPVDVMTEMNELTAAERKSIAELCYELTKRIYGSILDSSIRRTFNSIHQNIGRLFFNQIFRINQNLKSNPNKWRSKLAALREISLFSNISDFDLLTIAESIEEIKLKANEPFLVQYEEVPGVYLLKESANVYEFNSKIPVIARDGIFGDESCATGEKESSITVKPIVDCKALFIPRDEFVSLIRSVPGLQEKVYQTVVDRAKQGSIRAEEQRRLTQEILDNIGQGSFSINVAGEIGENYTAIAAQYLGSDNLAGIPFADLAFRNDRTTLRNYYRALHMLFSGTDFNHDVVLDLLPKEASLNSRTYKLHYSFVQDGAGNVMSVFVRMEDITLERELAQKEEQERKINDKMQKNIGGFMDMIDNINNTFKSIEHFAQEHWVTGKQPDSQIIGELMRLLHGSKGLAGQFELENLQQTIHNFEDWFLSVDRSSIAECASRFEHLFSEFEREYHYALSFKENLGEGIIQVLNGVSFVPEQFAELEQAVQVEDLMTVRSIIFSKRQVPAKNIISNWQRDILRLAEKMNKKIDFEVSILKDLAVPKKVARSLNVNLGHIYRNCIDHGIEIPEERIRAGKNETGQIVIRIKKEKSILIIEITDDGRGIDNQKIAQLATSNEMLDQEQVNEYIKNNEHCRILFLPGFSSASTLTDISGRGVGMDAVQKTIVDLNGEITMTSKQGKGTTVSIKIPIDDI